MPIAARRSSNCAASTGNRPQNTTGIDGRKPGSGFGDGLAVVGDGVADAGVRHFLDRGGEEADLAGAEFAGVESVLGVNTPTRSTS